jgi:hypothetical protein
VLGWAALIAWTGNGAVGWQARLCADADASVPACRVVAPAADGKVSWVWPEWDDIGGAVMAHGPIYWSVVVAAFDPAGHSKFVIVATAEHCTDCIY